MSILFTRPVTTFALLDALELTETVYHSPEAG